MNLKTRFPKYAAEAFGTFCLVFFGTGAIIINELEPGVIGHGGVSAVFGLIVMAVVYAIGHISGAHINPAVTVGFYSVGRLDKSEVLPYVTAQLSGAVLASGVLRILFLRESSSWGATIPLFQSGVNGLILEFILTFVLMFVIMGVATDFRAQGIMAGVAIGAVIALAALMAGPLTGASMNPARSFAPSLISGNFASHWIYWLGPILGSIAGAHFYKRLQCAIPGAKGSSGCC